MTKDFDARNERKSRSVCAAMAESADTGKCGLTERERCILGMWPRFEDGEPVTFGDVVDGFGGEINEVYITENTVGIWSNLENYMRLGIGERVKHPAPKVLDADGVEIKVGDMVYEPNGQSGIVTAVHPSSRCVDLRQDGCDAYAMDAKRLTHIRPDSWERLEEDAAKGPCEYAEVVKGSAFSDCENCPWWSKCGGRSESELMARDIIRRAKKLAGIEVE